MNTKWVRTLFLGGCVASMVSCVGGGYAPVVRLGTGPRQAPSRYTVRSGDTLYSIAWQFGLDYHQIAQYNHLTRHYAIYPGQHLRLKARQSAAKKRQYARPHKLLGNWVWPAKGHVIQGFKPGYGGNAGIDIAGRKGQPVYAAQSGTVVYSGNGVRGYGNLIIIKNSGQFLSAYAFNQRNNVTIGHRVKQGQKIAWMGVNNAGKAVLHFEIRQAGKPVDPMHFLH